MKKLETLKSGAFFFYGGVQWVVMENDEEIGAVLAIAAEPVFKRAFDNSNKNDWRESSLRPELNGPFLDRLVAAGANRAAFLDWESDLTADDGMTDYGKAVDKIALLSDGLYRKYRQFIPVVDEWCWTLTPWTCNPEFNAFVRSVTSSGALNRNSAYYGNWGVRPLCYLESSIFVSVPYEEECADPHANAVEEAHGAIMYVLEEYPAGVWGDAIAAVVASLFRSKQEAEDTAREEADTRTMNDSLRFANGRVVNGTPGDQTENNNTAAEG